MINVKTAIVDADPLFIDYFRSALRKFCSGAEILGIAENTKDGLEIIKNQKLDLVFLGTDLKDGSGFKLLDLAKKATSSLPEVVFLSENDQSALKAIRYKPLDYIIKPDSFDEIEERVKEACKELEKELSKIDNNKNGSASISSSSKVLNFVAIPNRKKIELIKLENIIYLESDGRYTHFHLTLDNKVLTSVKNLGEYEKLLDNPSFFRIHNSYIINLLHVDNIYRADGNYCILQNGKALPIAKRRISDLESHLKLK
ncbi:LytR/AlgR family response regulator transcription factor [Winogradskyella aurantiaca]|uniref:LytR/AlgR family response regulator transcription factor n=1 Tax=Winogradskyella aurantiaca TaxID=2219558 RepID=UPI000E1D6907|nr:LytTR family DNA-binding domain-containing protein [Winogradskyella aurantiaca]